MANIKSQIKRIKTNEKARQRNMSKKSAIKTAIKKAKLAIANNDQDVNSKLDNAFSLLDQSESKNIFHKNKVARIKSKLNLKYNNIEKTTK